MSWICAKNRYTEEAFKKDSRTGNFRVFVVHFEVVSAS